MATNTNTEVAGDASRASTVERTRFASKPATRVRGKRYSDDAIIASAVVVIRSAMARGESIGWVETLRTMRWTDDMAACDYARFTGKGKYARSLWADALAIASKPVRKPRAKRASK